MPRSFAFLVLEEHPYGREMLRRLLQSGHEPALLVEEASEVAAVERDKFLVRMEGFAIAPTFDELLAERPAVRRAKVPHHNRDECRALLEETRPDLIVLGGTRILKPFVVEAAPDGCLNAHPGLLPEVRGSASVAWAIRRDLPVGCTCHFIDTSIDTGPVVSRRTIPVHRGDTYQKLCHATALVSADLMAEALDAWRDGTLAAEPQGEGGITHKNMPDAEVAEVERKLAEGRYACFVD